MAKEKKRGFFSWLGFGQKEQAPENETEVKSEEKQTVAEDVTVDAPKTHTEAESEAFAAEVVDVSEQIAESEKRPSQPDVAEAPQPEVELVTELPEPTVVAAAIEREELPLPEEVAQQAVEEVQAETVSPQEWQAEVETVEIIEAVEEEGEKAAKFTDEELEAQALAAAAAEEAVMVVPVAEDGAPVEEIAQEQEKPTKEGFFARLKRSLLKTKENLGSGFISLFRGKKSTMICLRNWKSSYSSLMSGWKPRVRLSRT